MNVLKKIIVVLGVLAVLLFVVSLFLPGQLHIERSMVMNAPAENVFLQVNTLKNWEKWSPWIKEDPGLQISYSGPESGVGASYSWVGTTKKTGSGTLTISESLPGELVATDLDFGEDGTGTGGFRMESEDDATRVTWFMDSKLEGMIDKYMGLMMAGVMEKVFDQGLSDIRQLAESMPTPVEEPEMFIEEVNVTALHYLAVRDSTDEANIGAVLGQSFGMIQEAMKKQGLQMVGMPFAIYYTDSKTNWEFDACIGIDREGKADGSVLPGHRPEGRAVVAHYFGDYHGIPAAHEALGKYMAENGKEVAGPPWEEYVTDPGMEKDTTKWQTDVYYPVAQ